MDIDLDKAAATASSIILNLAPVLETGATLAGQPEIAVGIGTAEKLLLGALAGEPAANALVQQIIGGTPATAAQVAAYEATDMSAYAKSKADLTAAIAAAKS